MCIYYMCISYVCVCVFIMFVFIMFVFIMFVFIMFVLHIYLYIYVFILLYSFMSSLYFECLAFIVISFGFLSSPIDLSGVGVCSNVGLGGIGMYMCPDMCWCIWVYLDVFGSIIYIYILNLVAYIWIYIGYIGIYIYIVYKLKQFGHICIGYIYIE